MPAASLISINNLDNVLLPTRGINWLTEFTSLGGLTKTANLIQVLFQIWKCMRAVTDPAKVVAVLRLGAGQFIVNTMNIFKH